MDDRPVPGEEVIPPEKHVGMEMIEVRPIGFLDPEALMPFGELRAADDVNPNPPGSDPGDSPPTAPRERFF